MAVPDWPNTYGYNMFFFPVSQWVGGIFYEHTHRLVASAVGLLTVVLALWLHGQAPARSCAGAAVLLLLGIGQPWLCPAAGLMAWSLGSPAWRPWREHGLAALRAELEMAEALRAGRVPGRRLQGVLGGLRVVLYRDALGMLHATLAQLFFVLLCAIALFTSRWWQTPPTRLPATLNSQLSTLYALTALLILANSRSARPCAISTPAWRLPTFPSPTANSGRPRTRNPSRAITLQRLEILAVNPITAGQIVLQMVHRLLALAILGAVA